jgi:DNA-binding response OmpR family regulator
LTETGLPEGGERRLNLLVIEDDEKILEAISEYFSRAGYTVQTAGDGRPACRPRSATRPDAIVLDLMLPKMDGLAVCRELREKALTSRSSC